MAGIDDLLGRYAPQSAPSKAPAPNSAWAGARYAAVHPEAITDIDSLLAKYSQPDEPREVGGLEALGRGALQGATFGLSDEITGGLESAFTNKSYQQARDEARKANEEARKQHEYLYGAGELGGAVGTALIPGVGTFGALGRGAMTIGKAAKLGAVAGGLSGFGTSEADLTRGDAAGAVKDTALGAALGAGTGAAVGGIGSKLSEWASRASERIDTRTMGELGARAPKSIRDAMAALKPEVLGETRRLNLSEVVADPTALQGRTAQALDDVAGKLDVAKSVADGADVKATSVVKNLETLRSKLAANPANAVKVKKLDAMIEEVKGRYVPEPALTDKETLANLAKDGTAKQKERLGVRSSTAMDVIDTFGLRAAVKDPYALQTKTNQALKGVGEGIGSVYDVVQQVGGDIQPDQFVGELAAFKTTLAKNPAKTIQASEVARLIDSVNRTWGIATEEGGIEGYRPVPVRDFRAFVTELQSQGFSGGGLLDPTAAKSLRRELSRVGKGFLEEHLSKVADMSPEARAAVDQLPELNTQFSILKDFSRIGEKRVAKANITPPVTTEMAPPKTGDVPVSDLRRMIDELRPERDPVKGVVQKYAAKKPTTNEQIADTLQGIVGREVDRVAPDASKAIEGLERQRTTLDAMNRAAEYRARLEPYPMTGLRDVQRETNLYGMVRSKVAKVTGPVSKGTDESVARFVSWMQRNGGSRSEAALEAAKLGVPRAMAQKIIERFTSPVEDDLDD